MKIGDRIGMSILDVECLIGEALEVSEDHVIVELAVTKKWHMMHRGIDNIKPVYRWAKMKGLTGHV